MGHWQDEAACSPPTVMEIDREAFVSFPSPSVAKDLKSRFCDRCPVVAQCRDWAMTDLAFSGVAGGMLFAGDKAAGRVRSTRRIG